MNSSPDIEQIKERIRQYPHWCYGWDFGHGITTMPSDREQMTIQNNRLRRIFQAVGRYCGAGDQPFSGLRVLDVGCNEGLYAVEAKRLGASYVLGLEPRQDKVEQAQFIAESLGLRDIEYRAMSIMDITPEAVGEFDVVLCIGVLHHLIHPDLAIKKLRAITRRLLLVDTQLLFFDYPIMTLKEEGVEITTNAFDGSLVQLMSEPALRLYLEYAGFENVLTVERPKERVWKKSIGGRRYLMGSHGTLIAFPKDSACDNLKKTAVLRTGHEEVHYRIFFTCWKPHIVWKSIKVGIGVWARRLPGIVYRWSWIKTIADTMRITEPAKRFYHRIFYGA